MLSISKPGLNTVHCVQIMMQYRLKGTLGTQKRNDTAKENCIPCLNYLWIKTTMRQTCYFTGCTWSLLQWNVLTACKHLFAVAAVCQQKVVITSHEKATWISQQLHQTGNLWGKYAVFQFKTNLHIWCQIQWCERNANAQVFMVSHFNRQQ